MIQQDENLQGQGQKCLRLGRTIQYEIRNKHLGNSDMYKGFS